MNIKKFVDLIMRIGYKKLLFLVILLFLGRFFIVYGKDYYYLSDSYDKISTIIWIGIIGVYGAFMFLIESQDDIETQDDNTEKSNLFQKLKEKDPFIVFLENFIIVFIVIAFIFLIVRVGVIASLKYSNEPYITGKALLVDKYAYGRKKRINDRIFLLTNGQRIKVSLGNNGKSVFHYKKLTNKKQQMIK